MLSTCFRSLPRQSLTKRVPYTRGYSSNALNATSNLRFVLGIKNVEILRLLNTVLQSENPEIQKRIMVCKKLLSFSEDEILMISHSSGLKSDSEFSSSIFNKFELTKRVDLYFNGNLPFLKNFYSKLDLSSIYSTNDRVQLCKEILSEDSILGIEIIQFSKTTGFCNELNERTKGKSLWSSDLKILSGDWMSVSFSSKYFPNYDKETAGFEFTEDNFTELKSIIRNTIQKEVESQRCSTFIIRKLKNSFAKELSKKINEELRIRFNIHCDQQEINFYPTFRKENEEAIIELFKKKRFE